MDVQMLTRFFMWCTILNVSLLIVSFVMLVAAGDLVYKMHGKLFAMPRETFNAVIYSWMGLYKVLLIVFNLMPWLALAIIA